VAPNFTIEHEQVTYRPK